MTHRISRAAIRLLLPIPVLGAACGGSANDDQGSHPSAVMPAAGGATGTGGQAASTGGGSAVVGAGGVGDTGGNPSSAGGAPSSAGGGRGGAMATGGSPASAGTSSSAGTAGTSSMAGASSSGGSMAAGGSSSVGGAPSGGAGGSTSSTGGSPATCVEGAACDDGNECTLGDSCVSGMCKGAPSSDCGPIVHEWGTYTSVQGSDGAARGGVHHVDEALPEWVFRRNFENPQSYFFEELPEEPRQQLETPVLYFHSPVVRDVTVDVQFPEGIVGEWYPDAATFAPAVGAMTSVGEGSMTWNLTLDPSINPADFVQVSPDEIWAPSRHVASTPVRSTSPTMATQIEQFLFYRGLAKFVPPVFVTTDASGIIHLGNSSTDDLGDVFVLRATDSGGTFVSLGKLPAGGSIDAPIPEATQSIDDFLASARTGLHASLMATGLYDDEAQAMVDTWTRSWFRNIGVRVLYVAPRSWTEAWLPMTITPQPAALVRTLVGRIEVMTVAEENDIVQSVEAAAAAGTPIPLEPLGRFAEPRLERAVELVTTPAAKALAESTRQMVHASP